MPAYNALLALDIDGTLTPTTPETQKTISSLGRMCGPASLHINTARPRAYCERPSALTLQFDPANERHRCWNSARNDYSVAAMTDSKVRNMHEIHATRPAIDRQCVLLVDDIEANVNAARAAGYAAFHTPEGIKAETLGDIRTYLDAHCRA